VGCSSDNAMTAGLQLHIMSGRSLGVGALSETKLHRVWELLVGSAAVRRRLFGRQDVVSPESEEVPRGEAPLWKQGRSI
jgi:hypothetical protein